MYILKFSAFEIKCMQFPGENLISGSQLSTSASELVSYVIRIIFVSKDVTLPANEMLIITQST